MPYRKRTSHIHVTLATAEPAAAAAAPAAASKDD